MKSTHRPIVGALLGLSLLAACRGGGGGTNNPVPDGSIDMPTAIHIQDVQSDTMPVNTPVDLHGVIVTAVDTFGTRTGALWVEEPGGGPFSGVQVFGAAVTQVGNLVPGDIIDITGAVKTEFVLTGSGGDTSGRTTTELQAPKGATLTVTKTGSGTIPMPHVIDALALDAMTQQQRDAEYEKWEGVLVEVHNVRAGGFLHGFGSTPYPDDSYKVNITTNLVLESTQTKLTGIDGFTCFAKITGVEDYFFDWLLLPRSGADMVIGSDCASISVSASNITAIQAATPTGIVELDGVYVTAVSNGKQSLWISTSPTATADQGVEVFQSSTAITLDPAIVPGVQVNVTGTVSEFNDDTMAGSLTEVAPLRITIVNPTPATLTPVTQTPASDPIDAAFLMDSANAPHYESVLVTLSNVAITALGDSDHGFVAAAKQGTTTFGMGTDVLRLMAGQVGCYATITGMWTNLEAAGAKTKPNAFGFIPRTLSMVGSGTCN
jgi:hypothetical protein